jgi:sulfate permease, SulP family
VIAFGVEYGIVVAVVASVVDHLRHSYNPLNHVLVKSPAGYWQPVPVAPGARTEEGLIIYRFGTSLYYANAAKLLADLRTLIEAGAPLRWFVLDCAAIEDIDYTAFTVLARAVDLARQRHVRFAVSTVLPQVQRQLDTFGIGKALDPDARYETPRDALDAFHAADGGKSADGGHGADARQASSPGPGGGLPGTTASSILLTISAGSPSV